MFNVVCDDLSIEEHDERTNGEAPVAIVQNSRVVLQ
jgi:hypothetical protein